MNEHELFFNAAEMNRQFNAQLNTILDGIPGGLKVNRLDDTFSFVYASDSFAKYLGYNMQEVTELNKAGPYRFIHADDIGRVRNEIKEQLGRGDTYSCRYRLKKKDGSFRWVLDSGKVVHTADGDMLYSLFQDINEQEKSKEEFELILSSISCGVLRYRKSDHKIIMANDAAISILGYSSLQEMTESGFEEVGVVGNVLPEDREYLSRLVDSIEDENDVRTCEYRIRNKNSSEIRYCYGTIRIFYNENNECIVQRSVMDITDRKRNEIIKNENKELMYRLDALLNGIAGGFKISSDDEKYSYAYVSENVAAIQGYTVEELLQVTGGAVFSNLFPDDMKKIKESAKLQYRNGDTYSFKYRVLHKDGSVRWVLDSGKRIKDKDGNTMYYSLIQDITEQQNKNIELNRLLTMQNQMVSALGCGVLAYTMPQHEVLVVNEEAKRIFNYKEKDISRFGVYMSEHVLDDDREIVRKATRSISEIRGSVSYQFRIDVRKECTAIVRCTTKYLSFDDGQKFVLSVLQDVTEEENREAALQNLIQMQEQMKIIKSFGSVYFVSFSANLKTYAISEIMMPDSFRPMMEYASGSLERAVAYIVDNYVADESKKSMRQFLRLDTIAERIGDNKLVECEYLPAVGGWCRASIIVSKRDKDGVAEEVILAARDIDIIKKREIENKLALEKAYEEVKNANKAKSTFLNNMSHDIRTPMNAIIGFTTLAQRNIADRERVEDCLDKIMNSSRHLLGLINDVLDMSRIESGKMHLDEQECNLPEILCNMRNMVQANIASKGLTMLTDMVDLEHEDVYCDSLRLNQMLLNLVGNSIKFTKPGGTVSVKIIEQKNDNTDYASYDFVVKDNGIGMSEEFKEHIFDAFERERNSTISKIQGTGLGMTITKSIVDMMNGSILVESEQGKGTEITLKLEFRIQKSAHHNELSRNDGNDDTTVDFSGKRLLLVEDNELNREIANELLTAVGFEIDMAENGQAAVDTIYDADAGYYDLILMDVQMPVMNGYDATRAIRSMDDSGKAGIPIVAMTANAFEEDKKIALGCGMNGHIMKPIDIDVVISVLGNILK